MTEPQRLRELGGPAAQLLAAGELEVPSAARRRALAFTGAAAGMLASSGAAAASGVTLFKSVMLWVVVGTVGGGAMSYTVAETIAHFESRESTSRAAAPPLPLPPPRQEPARALPAAAEAAHADPVSTPALAIAPSRAEPARSEATSRAPSSLGRGVSRAASAVKPGPATAASPPSAALAPAPVGNLFDEQRNIEAARGAVARGDAAGALSTLDAYQRSYPQGQFGPEALALRVEALSLQGNREGAAAFARQFERRYPHHPLLTRVQSIVAR